MRYLSLGIVEFPKELSGDMNQSKSYHVYCDNRIINGC